MPFKILWIMALVGFFQPSVGEIRFHAAYENAIQHPYYMGETSKVLESKPGAAVELVKLLETKIPELKVVFSRCPWTGCLTQLGNGEVDGIFNGSYLPDRLQFGRYPESEGAIDESRRLTDIAYHFYHLKGSGFKWNGEQVVGLKGRIGTPMGYSIETDLKKMGLGIESALSSHINFANLLKGKVDALALQEVTGDYHISTRSGLKDIQKAYPAIKQKAYYLMLSKQFYSANPELAERIWDAIGQLRQEALPELIKKYY